MAVVAELSSPSYTKATRLNSSQLSLSSNHLSYLRRKSFRPNTRPRNVTVTCSITSDQVQAPIAVPAAEPKSKTECYGVFCLTYDLRAEEETKAWKKLINIAVSGAAGMIANHLLFKFNIK